jgi:hypothetical protein
MTKLETNQLVEKLSEAAQDNTADATLPLEDQFDKILMLLGNRFAMYKKRCEKALTEAQSANSYLICAKFQEHASCWDIAVSDIKDAIAVYRSGRAAERAKNIINTK